MQAARGIGVLLRLLLMALLATAGMTSAAAQTGQTAYQAWLAASRDAVRAHLRQTAASGQLDHLLAAAMLWSGLGMDADTPERAMQGSAQARDWFEAARAQGANDVLFNWIDATSCRKLGAPCDHAAALQRLQQLDGDNIATWLLSEALADASAAATRDAAWARAAIASHHDPHVLRIGRLLQRTMASVPQPPLDPQTAAALGQALGLNRPATPRDAGDMGVIGLLTAFYMPILAVPGRRCGDVPPSAAALRAQCRQVLARLADDGSLLASPMVALPLRLRLAMDEADAAHWRERLRQLHWVLENALVQLSNAESGQPLPDDYAMRFMREGELAAMRELLAGRGIAAHPPVEWLPRDPQLRALIGNDAAAAR